MQLVLFGAWLAVLPLLAGQRFDFTGGKPMEGYTTVASGAFHDAVAGYGFEPGEAAPRYFSVRVAEEGNYKVTITLGDSKADSVTTVKAELRRLMLERERVAAGEFATRSFIVNVRRAAISSGGAAGDREDRHDPDLVHRGRLNIHRPAARTIQQLGANADALLWPRHRRRQPRGIGRVATRIYRRAAISEADERDSRR